MKTAEVILSQEQRAFAEAAIQQVCERGGWILRATAAQPDHVHVLVDVEPVVHGKRVRQWMKRWLTEAMNKRWSQSHARRWWAEGGSTRVVKNQAYLNKAVDYIQQQSTSLSA